MPDFLTGLTSSLERQPRKGFDSEVPRTPEESAKIWKASNEYAQLKRDLTEYVTRYPFDSEMLDQFNDGRRAQQSMHVRLSSPSTLSHQGQIKLCLRRVS